MANGLFELPYILADDKRLQEDLLQQLQSSYDPKSNMSNPVYMTGVGTIRPYDVYTDKEGAGAGGYVNSFKAPTTVNLSTPFLPDATRVLAHEAAHVQKNIAERQVSADKKQDTVAQFLQRENRGEEGAALRKQLEQNFRAYVGTLDRKFASEIGGYGTRNTSWEERFADLQSLESQLPRGKSLLDTPLGQKVFDTPELKRYWMQTTLPLQAKALEQNPELQQNFFDKLETFNKTFKDESKTKSYFNAAMEALKKATNANEKIINPMYTDPFGNSI